MAFQGLGYNPAILQFQAKRGGESMAFLLPFLDPDMAVLDVGCGPGHVTAAFCPHVRDVIGLDVESKAIAAALAMRDAGRHSNLQFVEGDMIAMPFDDKTFDVVFFHAVLYHQDAIALEATLKEAWRVLKPGGLIATRDTDAGGNILYPETEGLRLSLDLWQRWYEHSSGDAITFGRRQGTILRSHGFEPLWAGGSYVSHSSDASTRAATVVDAKRSLHSLADDLIARKLASRLEIDTAVSAWETWGMEPDAVYLRCRCECIAARPRGR